MRRGFYRARADRVPAALRAAADGEPCGGAGRGPGRSRLLDRVAIRGQEPSSTCSVSTGAPGIGRCGRRCWCCSASSPPIISCGASRDGSRHGSLSRCPAISGSICSSTSVRPRVESISPSGSRGRCRAGSRRQRTRRSTIENALTWTNIPPAAGMAGSIIVLSAVELASDGGAVRRLAGTRDGHLAAGAARGLPLHDHTPATPRRSPARSASIISNISLVRAFGAASRERARLSDLIQGEMSAQSESLALASRNCGCSMPCPCSW